MPTAKKKTIWKIRTIKDYPEAHNHIIVGEVVEQTAMWVKIKGKTYHYGRNVNRATDIKTGAYMVRILPWSRVEIINELPETFDCRNADLIREGDSGIILKNGREMCLLYAAFDKVY